MVTLSFLCVFVACLFITGVSGQPGISCFWGLFSTEGPYTTVADGRILKWKGPNIGFVDFAYTAPTRTKKFCDATIDPNKGPICGRPLALSFQPTTGLLYIADAFFGLLVVGPNGGLATQLAGGFKFVSGVDVDLLTGNVYFSDSSLTYNIIDTTRPGFRPDSTGRLLRYNPFTRQVSVLLTGLSGGGGPAVSKDGTFVLVPEVNSLQVLKYWLVGPRVNTPELFIKTIGNSNKSKRAEKFGEFWVATTVGFFPRLPLFTPQGVRFNSNGVVLQTISFATQFFNKTISVVQEHDGKLYVGSRRSNFIGVYSN